MSKILKIKIPKYKSKVNINKLNNLIRLNNIKKRNKVSDLVVCFLKSFSFKEGNIKYKFKQIKREYLHAESSNLKKIIYLSYNVLNYMVYYKNKNYEEKKDLIIKINNFIRKNFRSQKNDINNINNLFYNLQVR